MYRCTLCVLSAYSRNGIGVIQALRNAVGVRGGVMFPRRNRYEGVRFNVIRVMRGRCQISRVNLQALRNRARGA